MAKPDFVYGDHATRAEWHYQPSEDKVYVKKSSVNEEAIARLAEIVRANGGTQTMDGGRLAASIPYAEWDMMEAGKLYGGRYRGIASADKETRERLLAAYLASDGRKYLYNDTQRGHY